MIVNWVELQWRGEIFTFQAESKCFISYIMEKILVLWISLILTMKMLKDKKWMRFWEVPSYIFVSHFVHNTGGMMSLIVKSKTDDSVKCEVLDGGELKSRRHLNVRGKSATLPSITGYLEKFIVLQIFYASSLSFCWVWWF